MEKKRLWVWAAVLLTALLLYLARGIISTVLFPAFVAAALAYLTVPLVAALEKRTGRVLSILLAFAILLSFFGMLLSSAVPLLIQQAGKLADVLPEYLERLRGLFAGADGILAAVGTDSGALLEKLMDSLRSIPSSWEVSKMLSGVSLLFLVPVLMFYFLRDREQLCKRFSGLLPSSWRTMVERVAHSINRQLRAYILGEGILVLLVSTLTAAVLGLAGFDYWLISGIFMGILNLIPYLGPVLGSIPALLTAIPQGWNRFWLALLLVVAVQQVDNLLLAPRVIGNSVRIHPAAVLLCVLAGNRAGSFLGMLLAIPVYIVVRILVTEVYKLFAERKQKSF